MVRAILAVCALMQLAAMLPHHHHDGNRSVCINYFDCSRCSDRECNSDCRRHNDAPEAGDSCRGYVAGYDGHEHHAHDHALICDAHKLVTTQPERDDIVIAAPAADIHGESCGSFCECNNKLLLMTACAAAITHTEFRRQPDAEPLLRSYISIARPSRAPDLLA